MVVPILVIAALAALPLAVTAATYAIDRRQRGDAGTEPLQVGGTIWAFLHEWLAAVALLAVLPFRLRGTAGPDTRRVVVFIPELHGSSATFWYLQRRLRAAGWPALAGVHRTGDGARALAALDEHLARVPAGAEIVLVGHGVGGLLGRQYAEMRPGLRIRHVVTLGTPHQGSRAVPYRWLGTPPLPVLSEPRVDVIALYSDFDAWLVPIDAAYCPGGFNIAVRGVGHCAMLQSRRVAALILENLRAPAPPR